MKVPLNDENSISYPEDVLEPTQPDTPTRTEDEEQAGSSPPSPSLRASLRKSERSSPSERDKSKTQPRRSRHQHTAKRTSDASTEEERSPKQRRTSAGKQKSEGSFAVPSVPLPRVKASRSSSSSSRRPSTTTSMTTSTTSFGSTTLSRTDSVFSDYRDNATATANTSFATSAFPSQPSKSQQQEEFYSSGMFGSIGTDFDFDQEIEKAKAATSFGATKPLGELSLGTEGESQESQNVVSPSKDMEQHQVRDLPAAGLFCTKKLSTRLERMSFKYRWEFMRVALETGKEPDELLADAHEEDLQDYSDFWSCLKQHADVQGTVNHLQKSSNQAWSAAKVDVQSKPIKAFQNITLHASLSFNGESHGPLFKIRLRSLQVEDTSCRFQRAFGGDRFLYLETPPLKRESIPQRLKGQEQNIADRFDDWLGFKKKKFLGRTWEVIHIEALAPRKQTLRRQSAELRGYRVILFATKGCDIEGRRPEKIRSGTRHQMTVFDLINWFMPLAANSNQPYLKVFARISLGLTNTTPALTFKPTQVRYIKDTVADLEREDDRFNDKRLVWPTDKQSNRVMNDGCALISVGAARQLWQDSDASKKERGPIPSTFQGRIGGAKGMWMISDSPDTKDPYHLQVWIEISQSQLKFNPHTDDLSDSKYDPRRLTFDLHSTTTTAEESSVYLSFFPILEDRGVSSKTLRKLFENHLDQEQEKLLEASKNPVHLRKWVNEQNSLAEERNREEDLTWQAGMPLQLQEKVNLLLEAGFDTSCDHLADVTQRLVAKSLRLLRQNVRVHLPRCTYIKGVADPLGILKPGEIHVHFSKSFIDEASGDCLSYLHNRPVLVARNPALRQSDIQKVQATFKLELGHLRDVVVFPSRGCYPLAGKLQGGDYDGDTFWVCWEPDLAEPFKNAPAPLEDPDPAKCGIKVDNRKLKEMYKGQSISEFLRASFKFRCKPNLLGQATKLYEKVFYAENSLVSRNTKALADLHDLLVDYAKNGYVFDHADFEKFGRECIKLPKPLPKPMYEEARERDRDEKKTSTKSRTRRYPISTTKYNRANILDRLYFETIEPHTRKTLDDLESTFKNNISSPDPALEAPYLAEVAEGKDDQEIADELQALTERLRRIIDTWNAKLHKKKDKLPMAGEELQAAFDYPDAYSAAVDACYQEFRALEPLNVAASPVIRRWHREDVNHAPCTHWELLRASALYHVWMRGKMQRSSTFAFHMAGFELCWIKAAGKKCRPMVLEMWKSMKPRQIKKEKAKRGRLTGERRVESGGTVTDEDDLQGAERETAYETAAEEIVGEGGGVCR
ncbi:hypothetical protein SLS57_004946 [Botryosphaeria dothidea]